MFQGCSGLESLDISQLTTGLGSSFPLMFDGTIKLKKIVLSENFSFYGHYEIERCYLPTPSSLYITGADGRWYVAQSTSYSPEEVPNRTAATYYAVKKLYLHQPTRFSRPSTLFRPPYIRTPRLHQAMLPYRQRIRRSTPRCLPPLVNQTRYQRATNRPWCQRDNGVPSTKVR